MSSRDDYVRMLKQAWITSQVKLLKAGAVASGGFMASPIMQKIIDIVATKICTWLANQAENAIFFQYIDMRGAAQAKDFETAAIANWKAQQSGTPEEKKLAEEELWRKFKAFAVITN